MPEIPATTTEKRVIRIPSAIVIKDLATVLDAPVTKVIGALMKNGVMSSMNERIDFDTAAIVAEDFGCTAELHDEDGEEAQTTSEALASHLATDNADKQQARPPVVVVMGHVDHGKTKLLDAIRSTNVVAGESGGITQHIGAYQVEKKGRSITFIDTPGHEAFTAMRSRGAQVADVAILVVAADDGIKPQTLEAIKIIQQSKVPFLVAVNKMDKPDANIDRVKKQLAEQNLLPEDWGGKIIVMPVSAQAKTGIDELLETLLILADIEPEKLQADPSRPAVGSVIEARIDKGEGPVATVLVHTGTLRVGDHVKIGSIIGKVKALKDWKGNTIEQATPSTPAKVLGLKGAPQVGDILVAINADEAKKVRREQKVTTERVTTKVHYQKKNDEVQTHEGVEQRKLNIVLRCDNLGSQEAILESLLRLETAYTSVEVVTKGLGSITDADVLRADTAHALLIGFHVVPTPRAIEVAKSKGMQIANYTVIYDLLNDIKKQLEAMLPTEVIETVLGHLRVLGVFRKEKRGMIIGGRVVDGVVQRGAKVRIKRGDVVVTTGSITQLQEQKKATTEVKQGSECGMKFEGEPLVEMNDMLECYTTEERKITLSFS